MLGHRMVGYPLTTDLHLLDLLDPVDKRVNKETLAELVLRQSGGKGELSKQHSSNWKGWFALCFLGPMGHACSTWTLKLSPDGAFDKDVP